MTPHPRNIRIKGKPQAPNRFIFGDAVDENGLEETEYLIHTAEPAFVCRLVGNDFTEFPGREQEEFASALLFDEDDNRAVYVCNRGLRLYDFIFSGELPTGARLLAVCDEAMETYERLHESYAERDVGPKPREMRVGPTQPLPPSERSRAIRELKEAVRQALSNPLSRSQFPMLLQGVLQGGDQAVFTESQLGLAAEPLARNMLVDTARDLIAFPEVMRKDGSVMEFELWALPFAFSRAQGGVWWHFPLLERLEAPLADALAVPEKAILWISPTVFTAEMLNERSCQNISHLASVMDAGCDFAPMDYDASRATFEAARKTQDPQLVLAWIPFLVERGALPMDVARQHSRRALDAVMPLVQQAIGAEMEYGEAELFAPLPWWEALRAGVQAWNRKRLGLTVAMLASRAGGLSDLEAVAEYQPELQGYEVGLKLKGRDEVLARSAWLMVPDVAPDREACWEDLCSCLREADIPLSETIVKLH